MKEIELLYSEFKEKGLIAKKDSFQELMNDLNDKLLEFFKEKKYDFKNLKFKDLALHYDKQLFLLNEKLKKVKEDTTFALAEGVDNCESYLKKWLEMNHIGFIKDFYLTKSGIFSVKFSLLITNFSTSKPISGKVKFEEQLRQLENLGIQCIKKMSSYHILATEENKTNIVKLLESEFNASFIELKEHQIRYQNQKIFVFDELSCKIPIEKLLFNNEQNKFTEYINNDLIPIKTETCSEDEYEIIKKEIREMYSAYKTILEMESLTETCCSVIGSIFCNICKILQIETSLLKINEEKYKKIHENSNEIQKKEKELSSYIKKDNFTKNYPYYIDNFSRKIEENLAFILNDIKLNSYGYIQATLTYQANNYSWTDDEEEIKIISDEELKIKYKMIGNSRENEDLFILGCDKNLNNLMIYLKELFPHVIINHIHYDFRTNYPIIKTIEISFTTIEDIILS